MAETYIQMFQEEFYPKIFRETAEETIRQYVKEEKHIIEQWQNGLSRYLDQIILLQKNGRAESVTEIDISFLYISLQERKSLFRIDCYGEGGRVMEESITTDYLPADWLTVQLDELVEKMTECAAGEGLRRYIRPAGIEVLKLRAVRSLLYYFAVRFKYTIREIIDFKRLAKVAKGNTFVIQMGEYMDWQRVLYAVLPEVDIFNCDKDTGLQFRKFPAVYYKEKKFKDLKLDQSRFLDCTFTDSVIQNCSMNDCVFEHCIFENVNIADVQMKGCSFLNCTFDQTRFCSVDFYINSKEQETEYFEPAEFDDCAVSSSQFQNCSLSNCIVTNCDFQEVVITGGCRESSGFSDYNGIVWKRDDMEG